MAQYDYKRRTESLGSKLNTSDLRRSGNVAGNPDDE
jgi:hypothetical protein